MEDSELTIEEKQAAIRNVVMVMLADGRIDPAEVRVLHRVAQRVGMNEADAEYIMRNPAKIKFVRPISQKERVFQLIDMIYMMSADGDIDPREKAVCTRCALLLGFNPLLFARMIDAIASGLREEKSREQINQDITLRINV